MLKDSDWSQAEAARQLELSPGMISQYVNPGEPAGPSKTVLKLFRVLLNRPAELRDEPRALGDAETRRADAAEAKLERAKKHLRAALAELEAEPSYRTPSSKREPTRGRLDKHGEVDT